MAQTPEVDRAEQIVQKLEGVAQDPDIACFFGGVIIGVLKPQVLNNKFTPDQYGRILIAFRHGNLLSLEEIDREITTARRLTD